MSATTTPGFIRMSTYMNFFEPHDLQKTDDELIDRYDYALNGYVSGRKVPSRSLLGMALRLCIRVNLCGHLCN